MVRLATLAALALLAPAAAAQAPGDCALGTAEGDLDVSDVFARVFNTGSLFFGNTTTAGDGYLVPQFDRTSPIFAAGLWVGGVVDDTVRVAGSRYSGFTFWPGPLNDDGTLPDPADCSPYDRVYVVSGYDVQDLERAGRATADLRDWPVGLGAPAVDAAGEPVVPTSRDQTLDLGAGERPALYGSQTAFWVMNDVGGEHTIQQTDPLGIEVRVAAFSVASGDDALNQATFYRYTIINRSVDAIEDARAGFFVDADLGHAGDDYVGTDSTRGMLFFYNGYETDAVYGTPPAVGFDVLSGASASSYFEGVSSGPTGDPSSGEAMYNFMQGLWGDGSPVRARGNGYGAQGGAPATPFVFPGDPVTEEYWSEVNNDGSGTDNGTGDRRGVISAGPFDLAPGASHTVDLAILFGQGEDRFDSVTELRSASDLAQAAYDDGSLFDAAPLPDLLDTPALVAPEADADFYEAEPTFEWTAVPEATRYRLEVSEDETFDDPAVFTVEGTAYTPSPGALPSNRPRTLYWRVSARTTERRSQYAGPRLFTYYRYTGGPLLLDPDGDPESLTNMAFVEVVGPGGVPACTEGDPSLGCAEVGGDLVYQSYNSTSQYVMYHGGTEGPETSIGAFGPNEFEVRFTDEGSYAFHTFSTGRTSWVPFEVWDVGVVRPGAENDPSDDVQIIPVQLSSAWGDEASECAFEFGDGETVFGIGPVTDGLYAYYPTTTYEAFAAEAEALAGEDGCSEGFNESADLLIDYVRGRPLQRVLFEDAGIGSVAAMEGVVIRFYTDDPLNVSNEGPGAPSALALGTAFPNPASGRAVVPFTVPSAGPVRLAVFDVLGREVAVLADGPVAAGEHTARLDTRPLAAGVYVVVLRADGRRAARTITVLR